MGAIRRPGRPGRPRRDDAGARQRLLSAAWALMSRTPPGGHITSAQVCREAGCSPPTLHHHFGGVPGLLAAAGEAAFARWAADVERSIDPGAGARERLVQRGASYVEWGRRHPRAYHVLFPAAPDRASDGPADFRAPDPMQPGSGVRELIADLAELRSRPPADPALLVDALSLWAAVHGLTTLAIALPQLPDDLVTASFDALADRLLQEVGP